MFCFCFLSFLVVVAAVVVVVLVVVVVVVVVVGCCSNISIKRTTNIENPKPRTTEAKDGNRETTNHVDQQTTNDSFSFVGLLVFCRPI